MINYECVFLSTAHELSMLTAYATSLAFQTVICFILTHKHTNRLKKIEI